MHFHTAEYDSAIGRDEALAHATVQMNLETIMLSESGQAQKTT